MPLAADIVASVARRLAEHAGLELPAWVIEARTAARIAALEISADAYVELIGTMRGAAELAELVETVRTGESSLFRHRTQITALTDVVVPAIRARQRKSIRVWSAGCASGEEPYTLAAILSRALPGWSIQIHATDVSAEALEQARRAEYPRGELADVPDEWRDCFLEDGELVRVRPDIAQLVRFDQANLVDAVPPRNCDVVWCRNVLIYFSAQARRRVIDRLVGATVAGGFVFVGYSESLREVNELEAQRAGEAVFYVKRGDWSVTERTPVPQLTPTRPSAAGLRTPAMGSPVSGPPTTRSSAPLVAAPPSTLVDPRETLLVLEGTPDAASVTARLGECLAIGGLRRLTIDLDAAVMLEDELAAVIRRGCAAARGAGIAIEIRATRTGAKRWVSRHGLDEGAP